MTGSAGRRTPRNGRSWYSYVLQVILVVALTLMVVRNWDDIQDSNWFDVLLGVLGGVAIVAAVVYVVLRGHAKARTAAPPGGWGGLAQVSIESLQASPKLQETAPTSTLSKVILNRGTVVGRLVVGDDIHFQPGPRAAMLGAEPFRISYDQLTKVGVKDRFLAFQLRGERKPVVAKVIRPRGLEAAADRLMR